MSDTWMQHPRPMSLGPVALGATVLGAATVTLHSTLLDASPSWVAVAVVVAALAGSLWAARGRSLAAVLGLVLAGQALAHLLLTPLGMNHSGHLSTANAAGAHAEHVEGLRRSGAAIGPQLMGWLGDAAQCLMLHPAMLLGHAAIAALVVAAVAVSRARTVSFAIA